MAFPPKVQQIIIIIPLLGLVGVAGEINTGESTAIFRSLFLLAGGLGFVKSIGG